MSESVLISKVSLLPFSSLETYPKPLFDLNEADVGCFEKLAFWPLRVYVCSTTVLPSILIVAVYGVSFEICGAKYPPPDKFSAPNETIG